MVQEVGLDDEKLA
jgi:hypothetical protein